MPLTLNEHLLCLAYAAGGIIVGVAVRLIPARFFGKIRFFKEEEVHHHEMDKTLTSKLRRKSSVRMPSQSTNRDYQFSGSAKDKSTLRSNSKLTSVLD